MARDLAKELDAWKGYPPAWRPQTGEILVGRLVDVSIAPNSYGGSTRVVTIEREDEAGRVAVWLGNVGLLGLFQREQPRIGDRLGLRFLGTVTTKAGRPCKRYHLIVDRPQAAALDFSSLGSEDSDEDWEPARGSAESAGELGERDELEPLPNRDPLPYWATTSRRRAG
jgi:hypothetical protein